MGIVSQFMQEARQYHWEVVLYMLQYIKGAPGKGLIYNKNRHVKLEAFIGATYVGSIDE